MRRVKLYVVYSLLLIFGIIPTIGYFVVERVTNGEPSSAVEPGNWATAVWWASGPSPRTESSWILANYDSATLRDPALTGGAPADAMYQVIVCGSAGGTVHGLFLLSGTARLEHPEVPEAEWKPSPLPAEVRLATGKNLSLAGVQAIPFSFPEPTCLDGYAPRQLTSVKVADAGDYTGAEHFPLSGAAMVRGRLATPPTHTTFTMGPLTGGRERRSWPTIGVEGLAPASVGIPEAGSGGLSELDGPSLAHTLVHLDGGALEASQTVTSATATPLYADRLVFESTHGPITAVVRTTNLDTLEHWQSVLTGLGILVGIAGGIFATLVIEGLLAVATRHRGGKEGDTQSPTELAAQLRALADRLEASAESNGTAEPAATAGSDPSG